MSTSKLEIINNALTAAGFTKAAGPNAGFRWTTLDGHYKTRVKAELESGNYNFGTTRATLSTTATKNFGFDYAWVLPNDATFIREVYEADLPTERDWTTHRGILYINANSGVSVDLLEDQDEQFWSATFALGIQQIMEGIAFRTLRKDFAEAGRREQTGQRTLYQAQAKSGQQRGERPGFQRGRLIDRRLRG